jgi:predicted ATPase
MKLKKLGIRNFRGISEAEFEFDQPTNVIVGPNAIGKTTILEAIRLAKSLLAPRYPMEGQQVLGSLGAGAVGQSAPLVLSYFLDYSALLRDESTPLQVSLKLELSGEEVKRLAGQQGQIALELLRGQMARPDDPAQLAMTQYLSSPDGRGRLASIAAEVGNRLQTLAAQQEVPIELTMDAQGGRILGKDAFCQTLITVLERACPPGKALFSYFPADRAFPTGEVNVQVGANEASAQIQSHLGQAFTKYQRLKQTIVNSLLLAGVDQQTFNDDFKLVLARLLPGKEIAGLSTTPIGALRVAIRELATGKVFDIDSMSSGEKGLILTFLLLRRTLEKGGIALIDEPELHLNPAVCKTIIPFLIEEIVAKNDLQAIVCTHSADILGSAFDRPDCSVYHLRSHRDATKIYERDHREVFDALRRLGTTAADSLFSRGNIFVEGETDTAILEEGFYETILGYKLTGLGGRGDVEREIRALQDAERRGEVDKLNCFIFDRDNRPGALTSSALVRVLQWDRYCLENYLLGRKTLYDELSDSSGASLGSRGEFDKRLAEIAISQLEQEVPSRVYSRMEPENAGLRPREVAGKTHEQIAATLVLRLESIRAALGSLDGEAWKREFVQACADDRRRLEEAWRDDWITLCNGKRVFDDLYREYNLRVPKLDLKRRVVRRMLNEKTEDWTLVKSKLHDALAGG